MSTTLDESSAQPLEGVLQGPFGSLVRDQYGIDNSDNSALFSPEGRQALTSVLSEYQNAGATIGGAPTYRLTNLRATGKGSQAWEYSPHEIYRLDTNHKMWNRQAAAIARLVYGTQTPIFGLLAPLGDTSGADDAQWNALGSKQHRFAKQRHRPQIEALRDAGIDNFLVEAGRYVPEAEALTELVAETGGRTLAFSFEAPQSRVPDSAFPDLRFRDVQDRLHDAGKGRIEVLTGINCVGASAVQGALDRNDLPPIVYPNQLDFGRACCPNTLHAFWRLAEKGSRRTAAETDDYDRLTQELSPSLEEFHKLYRACLQGGARIIGICCGGTPEHVAAAREEFDASTAENFKSRI